MQQIRECALLSEHLRTKLKIPPESEMIKMYEPWRPTARHLNPIIVSITHLLARKECTYDEVD